MSYPQLKTAFTLFILLFILLGAATLSFAAGGKIKVIVSILPQAYFVERIGGDRVSVQAVMPKYADHDTFDPTPKQLIAISQADVYVKIGLPHFYFESKYVDPLIRKHPGLTIIDMSKGIAPLPDDPHIWIAPHTVRISAMNIYQALAERYPSDVPCFKKNLDAFLNDIEALDVKLGTLFEDRKGAAFMIFHPALGYLAERYRLKQIVIEKEGKSPSAQYLRNLIHQAKERKIPAILVQKGFDHKSASAVATEAGSRLIEIDPLEKDWLTNTWQMAQKTKEALGQ